MKKIILVATCSLVLLLPTFAKAGSATWDLNPVSGDWNTAANWTPTVPPPTVPNGPNDIATFGGSHMTSVSTSARTEVNGITFAPGAPAYTITVNAASVNADQGLTISGVGITNDSGITQNFITAAATNGDAFRGLMLFSNNSTAGSGVTITNSGAAVAAVGSGLPRGATNFIDNSNADMATIINTGGSNEGVGGFTGFYNMSTAGSANITNLSGGVAGGHVFFFDSSSAGSSLITNYGGTTSGEGQGYTNFVGTSDAGSSTLIANGGTNSDNGGQILFTENSTGGTSRIEVSGYGYLDISSHNAPGVTIGSIEGDGNVFLGANNLTVGSNNLSTTFSGVIQDGGFIGGTGGSLTKTGSGTLELTRVELYTGNTTINDGVLKVNGVIIGPVTVNSGGTLGGHGATGVVTVNSGGTVAPGDPQTLHVNGDYLQNGGGILRIDIGGTAPGSFDQLMVSGGINLMSGSILDLDFINGFAPQTGDIFEFLTSGTSSITGNFSTVNIEGLQPGFEFTLGPNGSGSFGLTALNNGVPVSTPDTSSTVTLLLLGLTALVGAKQLLPKLA